jgi:hypothetical protein
VKWFRVGSLPGLTDEKFDDGVQSAFDAWTAVAPGLTGRKTANRDEADVLILAARIDGKGNALADMELPNGTDRVQRGRVDTSEGNWVVALGPLPRGGAELLRVMTHELGHFWGLGHSPDRSALMAPYVGDVDRPTSRDVGDILALYPEAKGPPTPKPTPVPPSGGTSVVTIKLTGDVTSIEIPGYRVTKLP